MGGLSIASLVAAMPASVAQGLIWGLMAIGVFITFKILNFADLTVDGSIALGGAVAVMAVTNGCPVPVAMLLATLSGVLAGLVTGL